MNVTKTGIALVALVVGCVVGGCASQFVIPIARAGTNPARWEYTCIPNFAGRSVEDWNKAGAQGWEFVWVNRGESETCFKRAL